MKQAKIPLEPQAGAGFGAHAEDASSSILPPGQHRFSYLSMSNESPEALVMEINQQAAHGWEVIQVVLKGTTFVAFLKRLH